MEQLSNQCHQLTLEEEATHILEEARMIIPGIQAIFGFQLIAVFSEGFGHRLESHHEIIHLIAMLLVLISMALVMSPAAYQRRVEPRQISVHFVKFASRMLTWGLRILTLGLAADIGVITYAVTEKESVAVFFSLTTLAVLVWLWFLVGSPGHSAASKALLNTAQRRFTGIRTSLTDLSRRQLTKFSSALLNAGYKYFN